MTSWLAAARPRTLFASGVPVVVGSAVAFHDEVFAWLPALAAFVAATLLQVGTNLANDYGDHRHGADTAERIGRPRASATGAIRPRHVRNAAVGAFVAAAAVGAYLVWVAGWPILVIGVASIAAGVLYTAGPRPLGYVGLGDVLVFMFFGIVAVSGTHFVQAGSLSPVAVAAGVPVGALATAILVVNNYRDAPTDRRAGKNTLAVLLGDSAAKAEYVLLLLLAYASVVAMAVAGGLDTALLLPLLTLPLGFVFARRLLVGRRGPHLNDLLESTARLQAMFGVLFALGWVL